MLKYYNENQYSQNRLLTNKVEILLFPGSLKD